MITVYIEYSASAEQIKEVEKMLYHELAHSPHWNGAEFKIERDESTWLEGHKNEYYGAELLADVRRLLNA